MTNEETLHRYVLETIGDDPSSWPGGWPGEIEAALIDAVFSVRAQYGDRVRKTGVFGAVSRWREHREGPADDLTVLAGTPEEDLRRITNAGRLSGRSKAQVVIEAAESLVAVRVVHAADFGSRAEEAKAAYLSVRGCGPVTWSYLRMLLGHDDVKPDTWIMRFVGDVISEQITPGEASRLVHDVAQRIGTDARQLDHAIWAYRRRRGRRSPN